MFQAGLISRRVKFSTWSETHTLVALTFALLFAVGLLGWMLILRHRLKKQAESLAYQANHDVLTGLLNRRAILDQLDREYSLALRSGACIGLMMLDVDHFKRVNDTLGHHAGDLVLSELGGRIRASVRSTELIGRFGGEEFLIVMPGCGDNDLHTIAERVRNAVSQEAFRTENAALNISVSMGIVTLEPFLHQKKQALAAADVALYESKRRGRDLVTVAQIEVALGCSLDPEG